MSLSKKNIDKLKSISTDILSEHNKMNFKSKNIEIDNPNDIFYSIIDNSNDINETTLVNKKLKESEEKIFNSKENFYKNNKDLSTKLTEEDLLYDEFNYLLEE